MKKRAKITDEAKEGDIQEKQKQEQSPLLQVNDDVLLLLFSHLLHLVDALHLGSTCRRLYGLYLKSCTNRRSLEIYRSTDADELRSKHTFEATAADKLTKDNHCLVALPDLDRTNANSITTFFTQLFACLPNLVSLEVVDEYGSKWTLPPLLTVLHSSPLLSDRLEALTLAIDENMRVDDKMLGPLHLPTLKHLTLYLNDFRQFLFGQFVLNSPFLDKVLPQLASFRLYVDDGRPDDLLQFITEHFRLLANAQLVAAIGTSSSALQIALNLHAYTLNAHWWETRQLVLPYVTSLNIIQWCDEDVEEILLLSPLLVSLKKVRIIVAGSEADAEWLSRVLNALAKLPKLETVIIPTSGGLHLARQLMPVLPTVRSLSLGFRSTYHANLVEACHLAHCFPGLQQISVSFEQYNCEFCDYNLAADDDDLSVFQECALRMSWDLQRLGTGTGWQAQVKLQNLNVYFDEHNVQFSSLENLLTGINDYPEVSE
ncbi:hypothetical protein TYRP_012884 [Tyrophagus putrescentiae]|nr:hypothetical protein TYRP_012884 [Tyrophagus putrescentiae]